MGDPLNTISNWLTNLLLGWNLPQGLVNVILAILGVVILATFVLLLDILLVWVERKIVARFQDRLGPNRTGPFGLIQPIADVIKLLIKEDTTPQGADRFVYNLAPIIALATVLLLWAVIPLTSTVLGSDINVGLLYIVAVGAVGTLGIIMAGWSSNNKYAMLGAFRMVAQMVSYEVPMVIILLVPVILTGSMGVGEIVSNQSPFFEWYIFLAPLAAVIFLITSIAELGRSPFDLTEAESEIVAGFLTEYSGMKFGLFYAGELLHALTVGALFATLFLGGWHGPYSTQYPILGVFYLFFKAFFVYFVIAWVRYSLPRVRIDQMLNFNWKFLTPLSITLVIVIAILQKLLEGTSPVVHWVTLLSANILLGWLALSLTRGYARTQRVRVASPLPVAKPPVQPTQNSSVSE